MTRLVLVHGAVTGVAIWDPLLPLLAGYDVRVPERPRTGSLPRTCSIPSSQNVSARSSIRPESPAQV